MASELACACNASTKSTILLHMYDDTAIISYSKVLDALADSGAACQRKPLSKVNGTLHS